MRNPYATLELKSFFQRFPDLGLRPSDRGYILIAGTVEFQIQVDHSGGRLRDSFAIEIYVPESFPSLVPLVREVGGRIPKTFHKLTNDCLCLGSPLRLQIMLAKARSLVSFVETCVLPYLAGYAVFENSREMPFGELEHGSPGLYDDYKSLLGVKNDEACLKILGCLSLRKRIANKRPCFCGSGIRLGRCHNRKVNALRSMASRGQYRGAAASLSRSRT
jgi:hypothetical protein